MCPPPAAEMLAPLSWLGQAGLIAALVVLNSLAWWACVVWSIRLTNPKQSPRRSALSPAESDHPGLRLELLSAWAADPPSPRLVAGWFSRLRVRRFWSAGALCALAAAIKAFPITALAYLLYRRYWIATLSLLLSLGLFLLVLPASFRGWSGARHDLARWADGMLFNTTRKESRSDRSAAWPGKINRSRA